VCGAGHSREIPTETNSFAFIGLQDLGRNCRRASDLGRAGLSNMIESTESVERDRAKGGRNSANRASSEVTSGASVVSGEPTPRVRLSGFTIRRDCEGLH
jgi:hypothetical protein